MRRHCFIICSVLVLFFISGCATYVPVKEVRTKKVDFPEVGVVSRAELGDTIIAKGKVHTVLGVELSNRIRIDKFFMIYNFQPGFYEAEKSDKEWLYFTNPALHQDHSALALKKNNSTDLYITLFTGTGIAYHYEPENRPIFVKTYKEKVYGDSFQQELIYNGKSGNTIRFLYREIKSDNLRFPFNQEMVYDLGESNIVGFKGSRIEVIEATNTYIKYRLIKNFPKLKN